MSLSLICYVICLLFWICFCTAKLFLLHRQAQATRFTLNVWLYSVLNRHYYPLFSFLPLQLINRSNSLHPRHLKIFVGEFDNLCKNNFHEFDPKENNKIYNFHNAGFFCLFFFWIACYLRMRWTVRLYIINVAANECATVTCIFWSKQTLTTMFRYFMRINWILF